MDITTLRDRIIAENKIKDILQGLNMKCIENHNKYYSCCMPDGDNKKSTIVYKNSLHVDAHTRNIEDKNGYKNIISLVMYIKNIYFVHAIKWICEICGFDYYCRDYKKPSILSFFEELESLTIINNNENNEEKNIPISEKILEYYGSFPNKQFLLDGISIKTQIYFEIGLDMETQRITIPIRDELGTLVGIKGRLLKEYEYDGMNKYIYLESCNKNQMLFGLDKTFDYIKKEGYVIVAESEKAILQGWSHNIKNVVSIGGHILSKTQVKMLIHLGVPIWLAYDDKADFISKKDEDGNIIQIKDKDFYKKEKEKFLDKQEVYAIIDKDNEILGNKESPFDNLDMWEELKKKIQII